MLTFRQLTSHDKEYFAEGVELLNRTQGRDLFPSNYLHEKTADPKCFAVAAFDDRKLIGVGLAQIINNYDYYLPFDPNINKKFQNKKIGSFSTLCVHEGYQGKGIGQKLSQLRLEWVKNQNCDFIVGVSWISGLPHTSDRVFEKMGFERFKRVDKFYVNQAPFECPGCNTQPCQCSAALYIRKM